MRICILARSLPIHNKGGLEDAVWSFSQGLGDQGQEITIITASHPQGLLDYEEKSGIKIHYLSGISGNPYSFDFKRAIVNKFLLLHQESPFNLVSLQSSGGYAFLEKDLGRKLNIPTVLSLYGTSFDELITRFRLLKNIKQWKDPLRQFNNLKEFFRFLFRFILVDRDFLNRADLILAPSPRQAKIVQNNYGITKEKVKVIFNGVDTALFRGGLSTQGLRQNLGISTDSSILLFAARLVEEKGAQVVIESLPDILNAFPQTVLVIVGDGEYLNTLKELADRLKLTKQVVFTGSADFNSLPLYFNLGDIFINSTLRENGYDLTLLEAMACSKAVIASNIGSNPTVINSGKDGILIEVGNIKELSAKILELLENKEKRLQMGLNGRRKIEENFSQKAISVQLLEVFESLVKN